MLKKYDEKYQNIERELRNNLEYRLHQKINHLTANLKNKLEGILIDLYHKYDIKVFEDFKHS